MASSGNMGRRGACTSALSERPVELSADRRANASAPLRERALCGHIILNTDEVAADDMDTVIDASITVPGLLEVRAHAERRRSSARVTIISADPCIRVLMSHLRTADDTTRENTCTKSITNTHVRSGAFTAQHARLVNGVGLDAHRERFADRFRLEAFSGNVRRSIAERHLA